MVRPKPDGYSTVTPYLAVTGAAELIEFLNTAYGAAPRGDVLMQPDGTVGHAELKMGDSLIMVGEAPGEPVTNMLHLYVDDCDATYKQALAAGAESTMEPADQFYGDRMGGVKDKWGNQYYIATHVEDVGPEEMARRVKEQYQS